MYLAPRHRNRGDNAATTGLPSSDECFRKRFATACNLGHPLEPGPFRRSDNYGVGHAPLLKLTKASIIPNRDDSHALHRLVDNLFAQLQERLACDVDGPAAFRAFLIDVADDFDRAPRGAASETLHRFEVLSGMPFSSYVCSFRVVVARTR